MGGQIPGGAGTPSSLISLLIALPHLIPTLLPQATGTRATKLELAGSYDQAFTAYLSAAQTYLFLVRNTTDTDTKVKLRAVSGKLVERAERIKAVRKKAIKPVERDPLSLEEQDAVLEKGSSVLGRRLRRWREEQNEVNGPPPPLPPLSPAQQAIQCSWVRCMDVLPGAKMIAEPVCGEDIVQDNVSDCSVVAALIVAAQHHARYDSKLGLSCLFPQDENGLPKISPSGHYSARFLVNGTWRRLDIDDRLPVSAEGQPMCASTRKHDQLWPTLLEKAYLTLMGGYDFSGSNSANDLYAMSGWLPESLSLRSGFRSESTWQRIRSGFSFGHCVLSVGTGKSVDGEPSQTGLIPSHNYVVADVREERGVQQLVLINPWRTTTAESSENTWTAGLRRALGDAEGPQTLVVNWDALPARFASLHVNWDPDVFDFSDTAHLSASPASSSAPSSAPSKHRHSMHLRLQIEANPSLPSEVWLLLARHTSSPLEKGEYIGIVASKALGEAGQADERLRLDVGSSMHDNLYDLYRFLPEPGATCYDLLVSHEGSASEFAFTLRAFSNCRVKVAGGPPPLPYAVKTTGAWTTATAGGNHTCHSFFVNPQYAVKLAPLPTQPGAKATLEIVGETDKDSPINVKLLYRNGARVADFESRDVLAGSSTYAYGLDSCSAREIPPGTYTLVVSSFQPRHLADFSLAIKSSLPVEVVPVPPEGAGMYARQVKGVWAEGRDGGRGEVLRNPRFALRVTKPTSVKIRLQTPSEPRPIAVSIFSSSRTGEPDRLIASSGAYTDAVCGAVLPLTRLEAAEHGYLVVPSTFHAGVHAEFVVLLYADASVTLAAVDEGV